ncbi:hypothetical protein CLV37_1264 [Kineococcus rhizosphaerae]|uniref:Uncharacterized protein n=2 Tax=Kineococcus rhizosphaerae TaxID=559628 RepID=A0A2T0QSH0_9ACTN|nr:hypothetical protein CLV37_1264 [Kineococcus rhizosphaerae]
MISGSGVAGADGRLTGLERLILELASDGIVMEEPDSRAVAATYREQAHGEFIEAA